MGITFSVVRIEPDYNSCRRIIAVSIGESTYLDLHRDKYTFIEVCIEIVTFKQEIRQIVISAFKLQYFIVRAIIDCSDSIYFRNIQILQIFFISQSQFI